MNINQRDVVTVSHEFNAPRKKVFEAFTNADALNAWWGPVDTENTVLTLDFRVGGIFHYRMKGKAGVTFGRFLFVTINPHSLLEFTNAFADEHANVVDAPFDIALPKEIFYRLTFTEKNKKTTLTLKGYAVDATPGQTEGFKSIHANMQEGFGATFSKLTVYLERDA